MVSNSYGCINSHHLCTLLIFPPNMINLSTSLKVVTTKCQTQIEEQTCKEGGEYVKI